MLSSILRSWLLGEADELEAPDVKRRIVGVEGDDVDDERVALNSPLAIIDRRSCSVIVSCGIVGVAREAPSGSWVRTWDRGRDEKVFWRLSSANRRWAWRTWFRRPALLSFEGVRW